MGNAIGEILAPAIGVAISPVPIIAVILMLFTRRPKSISLAFLGGWILGLAIVSGIVLAVAQPHDYDPDSGPSTAAALVRLVLGVLLFWLAVRQWRSRPKPGEEPHMPGWLASLDSFTPVKSLGLGAILSGINPKNLALTLSAAMTIAQAELGAASTAGVMVVFIIIASISVAAPIAAYLVMGDKAARTLDGWKVWLTANNHTVMFVLLLVFAVVLLGKGISGLTS
jgi:hypothetical protein